MVRRNHRSTISFENGIKHSVYENTVLLHADCFELLSALKYNSLSAIVTDPPYGVKEYEVKELGYARGQTKYLAPSTCI